MPEIAPADLRVRSAVYGRFGEGVVPSAASIAADVGMDLHEVRESFERLADAHALVLDPASREVWMAMPFSAIPTPFRVEGLGRHWHANCAWDAFGIAVAMQCDVTINTTCADCGEPMAYGVSNGALTNSDGVTHFAVPARSWWDDIGYT